MSMGEGVGGVFDFPPVLIEIEVETTPSGDSVNDEETWKESTSPPPSPPLPFRLRTPFTTGQGFGNWLFDTLDPTSFYVVHAKFLRYCQNLNIRKLIRIGKQKFQGYHRLHFLKGLKMIAVTMKQKDYVSRKFVLEMEKLARNNGKNFERRALSDMMQRMRH